MPLEIRELHIKVNIGESAGAPASSERSGGASPASGAGDQEKLLATCVDEVMRIMATRKER